MEDSTGIKRATKDSVQAKMRGTLARHAMLAPDEAVLVAVSGGADSVALARLLKATGHPIEIAHFDHMTRGGASAEDAAFVATLAGELGVPFHTTAQPVAEEARNAGASFEAHARDARYAFLFATAKARGITAIATGHHAGDQAETVLMRLLRGTGPGGLSGIPPVREEQGLRVVRPLLDCAPEQLRAWLLAQSHPWREDASNTDPAHLRNRIRHQLLPLLAAEYNPQIRSALLQLTESLAQDATYLDSLAEATGVQSDSGLDRAAFSALPLPLQRRCFRRFAWGLGSDPDYETTITGCAFVADAPTGRRFDLGGGVLFYNGRTHTDGSRAASVAAPKPVVLPLPGNATALGQRFTARFLSREEIGEPRAYCNPNRQVFDADKLDAPLFIRGRAPGDTMIPFGMSGHRKVQDILVDLGVPAPSRDTIPLLYCGATLLWIGGHTVSATAAITEETRRVLEICTTPQT